MGYSGLLFIGDLHASSKRPGRRIDDYAQACLNKLSQCARIAKERNAFPVFLGDFFHRAGENNLAFLAQMMDVCRQFEQPLWVLAGDHDRAESWFTEKDAAYLLSEAGVIRLIDEVGLFDKVSIQGVEVGLWGAPALSTIPTELGLDQRGEFNVLITHHDFDFRGPYPGALELAQIDGCDMLVNGHMHTPTPSVVKGNTVCHNPGSVTRVAVDLVDHKPVVSLWCPAQGASLEKIALTITPRVFDLTGTEVASVGDRELKKSLPKGLRLSSFAAKLRSQASSSLEATRSEDGSILIEELDAYFKLFEKPDNVQRYIKGLIKEVLD